MIDDINFLPAGYHRTRHRRQRKVWRRGVCAVFLLLVVAGSLKQWQSRRALEETREKLRARAAKTLAELGPTEPLEEQIAQFDARANLLARLRVRIPPTRLLADITASLPDFVSLTQVRVSREHTTARPATSPTTPADTEGEAARTPAEIDLAELVRVEKQSSLTAMVTGIAPDDVAISHFLAALQKTGTFSEVHLLYTDETDYREHRLRGFAVRLVMRKPGQGLPASATTDLTARNTQ